MSETETTPETETIQFNYIKSNHFRVIHADGAMGSITPRGNLFLGFYSERVALPDSRAFKINDDGTLGDEVIEKRYVKSEGVIREIEVGVSIDAENAKAIVEILSNFIQQIESNDVLN